MQLKEGCIKDFISDITPNFNKPLNDRQAVLRWSKGEFDTDDYNLSRLWRPYKTKQDHNLKQKYDDLSYLMSCENENINVLSNIDTAVLIRLIDLYLRKLPIQQCIKIVCVLGIIELSYENMTLYRLLMPMILNNFPNIHITILYQLF